ncbi:MAG: hypothetical protein BWY09_01530 [Candidatus Hydrogenedentes bacterium ADurb.Bin179]|nr:MAG: hypothetical protein BWY09_01530 [Candidatus Hydrogenedentes bacterium ADurb.Bin179]
MRHGHRFHLVPVHDLLIGGAEPARRLPFIPDNGYRAVRTQDTQKLPARLFHIKPMEGLPHSHQVHTCRLKTGRLRSPGHAVEVFPPLKHTLRLCPHLSVRLHTIHPITTRQEYFRQFPRPGTDIRHHGPFRQQPLLFKKGNQFQRIAGTKPGILHGAITETFCRCGHVERTPVFGG